MACSTPKQASAVGAKSIALNFMQSLFLLFVVFISRFGLQLGSKEEVPRGCGILLYFSAMAGLLRLSPWSARLR
jgi:hypothetical protein